MRYADEHAGNVCGIAQWHGCDRRGGERAGEGAAGATAKTLGGELQRRARGTAACSRPRRIGICTRTQSCTRTNTHKHTHEVLQAPIAPPVLGSSTLIYTGRHTHTHSVSPAHAHVARPLQGWPHTAPSDTQSRMHSHACARVCASALTQVCTVVCGSQACG